VDHDEGDRERTEPAEEGLVRAAKAYRRTEKAHEEARQELKHAAVRAMAAGVKQSDVVKVTGWTREYLRRLRKKNKDD
jgi:ABC-type branched-subunit amino acid transport system substrate-binding protein